MTVRPLREPTAEIILQLRVLIDTLAPGPGDRLPPERELATSLGCSRMTLRKALASLERQGEIWRHVGQGTFRGHRPNHLPVRETIVVDGITPPDVMRARQLIEPQVAAEAARRATARDLEMLRTKVEDARQAHDRRDCEAADDAFHKAVAQVAGNPLLLQMLVFLSGARRRIAWQQEWDRTYRRIGVDEFRGLHSDQHAQVVDAIAQANPDKASNAMKAHLDTIELVMSKQGITAAP